MEVKLLIPSIHRRRRIGAEATPTHKSYPGKSETYLGKFENIQANLKMNTFFSH